MTTPSRIYALDCFAFTRGRLIWEKVDRALQCQVAKGHGFLFLFLAYLKHTRGLLYMNEYLERFPDIESQ